MARDEHDERAPMSLHRPGTRAHREATYRAMCEYQDGLSILDAARRNHINADTLRHNLKRHGFVIRPCTPSTGSTTSTIPDSILRLHPTRSVDDLAAQAGTCRDTMIRRLKARGTYKPRRVGQQPAGAWANSLRNRTLVLQAVELRRRGYTQGEISIKLSTPRGTIGSWFTKYNAEAFLWQRGEIPKWWSDAA
jgi:hypothetical protein